MELWESTKHAIRMRAEEMRIIMQNITIQYNTIQNNNQNNKGRYKIEYKVKECRVINEKIQDEVELQSYAVNIHKNAVQCMQILLDAQQNLQISIDDPEALVLFSLFSFLFSRLLTP